MRIKVNGGQFFVNGYPVQTGFTLSEGEERTVSYIARRGAGSALLRLQDGELLTEGEIGRIDWSEGVELYPLEEIPACIQRCEVQGAECLVRFGREIEVGDYRYEPPLPVLFPTARSVGGQRAPIVRIDGRTAEGDYLALLSVRKGEERLLLDVCGEVRTVENEVTVTRRCKDLRARTVTDIYRWRGEDFERTSHTLECAERGFFPREQRGRLLLEAVMAEDEEELRALTTSELSDLRAMSEYFGETEKVRAPLFTTSPTAVAAQKKTSNGRVCVTYDFSFEGDKIDNIFRLDE